MEINKKELKERLTEEEYNVTQNAATEQPYTGKYYKNKENGVYNCKVCDAELFKSDTKFDSYSGWPSFFDPINTKSVKLTDDSSHGMVRTEVSCNQCGAHLGHVFNDAPETKTGQRYCINSCSLDFKKDEEGK